MLLISVLIIITLIYALQGRYPVIAGVLAIIPIKIISTAIFAYDRDVFKESIGVMLIGQFIVGFILLFIYLKW